MCRPCHRMLSCMDVSYKRRSNGICSNCITFQEMYEMGYHSYRKAQMLNCTLRNTYMPYPDVDLWQYAPHRLVAPPCMLHTVW